LKDITKENQRVKDRKFINEIKRRKAS